MRTFALLVVIAATGGAAPGLAATPPQVPVDREAPIIAECTAALPATGQSFSGTVLQVIDGQTLCVANGPTPSEWIRVTIAGAAKDADRSTLMATTFGAELVCVPIGPTSGGVLARCEKSGVNLDQVMTTEQVRREAVSWR